MEASVILGNDNNDQEEKIGRESMASEESTSEIDCVFSTNNPPSSKAKRKITRKLEDDLLTTCLNELKKPKPEESSSDGDTVFGQYIANQLRKIPDGYAKERLKIEIQQSIMKVMLQIPPLSTIALSDLQ